MIKRGSGLLLPLLFGLLLTGHAHAQLYKWVGQDGKVTYSDTPPPSSAKKVEEKTISATTVASNLPFELASAIKAAPVTLYTTSKCSGCDSGRALLNARGIPYTEKTVNTNEDLLRLQQAGGDKQLPFLTVGRSKQSGFEAEAWNSMLSAAAYPENSQLPATYRNPAAQPAAPKKTVEAKPAPTNSTSSETSSDRLPAAGNAPPGFQF
ncbi:hypothetical protein D3C72_144630 [compost metagenome]